MMTRLFIWFANGWRILVNLWRQLWRRRVDWVRLEVSGQLPEFATEPSWWQRRMLGMQAPLSLHKLRQIVRQVAYDPHTKGVLLRISDLSAGWATLQSFADEIAPLRAAGKRVVAYALDLSSQNYRAACAADTIIVPPLAFFNVLGVRSEVRFLKDALTLAGLEAEYEAVSPYKSAGEPFIRSDISPENLEQLERLVNQRYTSLVEQIAQRRQKSIAEVRELIDQAPYSADDALAYNLIDGIAYEDEIEQLLQSSDQDKTNLSVNKLIIRDWPQARQALQLAPRSVEQRLVGVITIEGGIVSGRSRRMPVPLPLIGGEQSGADTVIQAIRRAERNKRIAAVVLYVNSPGGDAFASDLIWREVLRLVKQKPVVVAMGDAAASGGYYVAVPASAIVAQPGTLTGSIGVFSLRFHADALLERFNVNTVVVSRGARTGLLSAGSALNVSERTALRETIFEIYTAFRQRVSAGRSLSDEQVEAVAGGRVWTGQEALERGLVDQLGGFSVALMKAQELGKVAQNRHAPIAYLNGGRSQLLPQPFPTGSDMRELLDEISKPRILAALPYDPTTL
jgi:protease-4